MNPEMFNNTIINWDYCNSAWLDPSYSYDKWAERKKSRPQPSDKIAEAYQEKSITTGATDFGQYEQEIQKYLTVKRDNAIAAEISIQLDQIVPDVIERDVQDAIHSPRVKQLIRDTVNSIMEQQCANLVKMGLLELRKKCKTQDAADKFNALLEAIYIKKPEVEERSLKMV